MPASGDCELIRDGLLTQPVNALSSLAFVVVGLMIIRSRPVLGGASCGVGVGSFLFHGPMPGWAEWAHDVSLAVLVVALVLETRPWLTGTAATMLGAGFAFWPGIAEPITGLIALGGMVALILRGGPWPTVPAALLVAGAAVTALSRTGGPMCSPESLFQGHAVWHLLGAAAVWAWSRFTGAREVGFRP